MAGEVKAVDIMGSPCETLPEQVEGEVTEPQSIPSEGSEEQGDEEKGGEVNLELPVAPAEPMDAAAGHAELRQDSIDSTETECGSHRRSASSGSNSCSSSSSGGGDDISFQYVDPFPDIAAFNQSPSTKPHEEKSNLPLKVTIQLAFQAIGVVFGDLGASPLFVYDSTFGDGAQPSEDNVLGALSLIIYTVTLIPLIKYITIVLKANDNGNGETFALYSLICRCARIKVATYQIPEDQNLSSCNLQKGISKSPKRQEIRSQRIKELLQNSKLFQDILLLLALFGTCAFIGDGVLTPSISVLWAVSGVTTKFPGTSEDTVTYSSAALLVIFFCLQCFGTDRVSFLFSPFLLVWFTSIFAIGAYNIHFYPSVFKAFNPYYIYLFFERNKKEGLISLAGIVLAITGSESIVTDMGHFSVASIQIAFSTLVYPSLLVAYIGQAAFLIHDPSAIGATFYKSIPGPLFWPMFVIANATAIIASQGIISSTFCIVEQCMALGCFPRCKVVHTSKKFERHIYIPEVNWILMILTVSVTIGFGTTGQIGDAYGLAVVSVMLVTTTFLTLIMVMVWQRSLWIAGTFFTVFMAVETVYYSSVLYKVPQGGWVPVIFVVVVYSMMYIWHYGRKHRYLYEINHKISTNWAVDLGSSLQITRVQGVAFLYSELADGVPTIFTHLVTNLKAMHSILVFICIQHLPISHVLDEERLLVHRLGPKQYHMYRIAVRYGYTDHKVADLHFEGRLIDSLAGYIAAEELRESSRSDGSEDASAELRRRDRKGASALLRQSSLDSDDSDFAVVLSAVPHETSGQDGAAVDLVRLEQSRRSGVTYLLGRTEVRAAEGSSTFRRFIIDKAYNFLRKNCRAHSLGLNVPPSRTVQIGMLHRI